MKEDSFWCCALAISSLNLAIVSLDSLSFSLRSVISLWTFLRVSVMAARFLLFLSSKSVVCL